MSAKCSEEPCVRGQVIYTQKIGRHTLTMRSDVKR